MGSTSAALPISRAQHCGWHRRILAVLLAFPLLCAISVPALAAKGVRIASFACSSDSILVDSFDYRLALFARPTNGSGGASGDVSRTLTVAGASHTYVLRVPPNYSANKAYPLLIALHGAGGPGTAPANAVGTRDAWASIADAYGVIVAAPVASGTQGGSWVPSADYPFFDMLIEDVAARYNIDRNRIDLWGFSAGGHVAHDLALTRANFFSAYSVSAGALDGYAGATAPATASRIIPVDIHVGISDPLYSYAATDNGRFIAAQWTPGNTLNFVTFAGGHNYTVADLEQIWNYLCPFAVIP